MSKTLGRSLRIVGATMLAVALSALLGASSASAQELVDGVYECAVGNLVNGDQCSIPNGDTFTPGTYVPAVAAVPGTSAQCPPGFTSKTMPVTDDSTCFAPVTTAAQVAGLTAAGADCSNSFSHPNETAKGFCTVDVIPGTPAIAAISALCDGVPTTQPASACGTSTSNPPTLINATFVPGPFILTCPTDWTGPSPDGLCTISGSAAPGVVPALESVTYTCSVGMLINDTQCAIPTLAPGVYEPGTPAVPAIPATPDRCPVGFTSDTLPVTIDSSCFATVTTAAQVASLITAGADCSASAIHPNGTAKGFCTVDVIPAAPGTDAIAAVSATCNGEPTTQPFSACTAVNPPLTIVLATQLVTYYCLDGYQLVFNEFGLLVCVETDPGTSTATRPAQAIRAAEFFPTVTCLAGNGRIDMNILSTITAEFTVTIGNLNPRVREVQAGDWWRSPVTGRQDGPIAVAVVMDGVLVFDKDLTVACDEAPAVSAPEVQPIVACRAGLGFVAWQFANPSEAARAYIIEFDGVPNRSTTAQAYGASIRGVSGRSDGNYSYSITAGGDLVSEGTVMVDCEP